ncbi:carbohydrate ABC transporter permease [Actinopolymorpha rutila]|uniref:Putative aldouronate transport system permease protein n=1 Tax=Actinopolymorpha rutila TaxID=446787 RepID=A0A852ZQD2_9ACTN|nr:carbohydrate ABC transporter permease [Actinopolymorpha rutila]NYH90746.1 putative aldouronate transport system permease protein [Actinopolymorpha rutila]
MRSRRDVDGFRVVATVVSAAFAVACLLPFWLVVASSLTSERELVAHGYTLWPREFSLAAYHALLTGPRVGLAYLASVFITVVGTSIALVVTAALAYVIAGRLRWISKPLTGMTYLPMLFSGGLVPFYILVTQYLHLTDTYWSVILPNLVSPFLVFVMVAYFRTLPVDVLDSARIDGASELTILFRIVLPIAKPILATVGLFYALHYWNEWFMALLFISDPDRFPLQLLLQNMIANVDSAQAIQVGSTADVPIFQLRMALVLITIGPIILAYPFVQRYFVRGLTLGATKG